MTLFQAHWIVLSPSVCPDPSSSPAELRSVEQAAQRTCALWGQVGRQEGQGGEIVCSGFAGESILSGGGVSIFTFPNRTSVPWAVQSGSSLCLDKGEMERG